MDPRAKANDLDPVETREWIDSLAAVLAIDGEERAHFLIEELIDHAGRQERKFPIALIRPTSTRFLHPPNTSLPVMPRLSGESAP
ncbi:MAG: hypothetical protein CM1200mP41_08900 [Gammaproteobacteria bacterium]|nr:MAG: hypothetical protein CM1200mP41_08900 [Gammaproteobacteria bacterium]